jgi:hypothetical protein
MAKNKISDQIWEITLIGGKRGHVLGRVKALDADDAIKRAIIEFAITSPHERKRLAAQRVGLRRPQTEAAYGLA